MTHQPVTTLADLDALDHTDMVDAYCWTNRGDPEPGGNHSRGYHHGWRTKMMDLGEIAIPPEHRELTRLWLARQRRAREVADA